jgi:hypothetical protein
MPPRILDLALEGGEWPDSRSGRFAPRERGPGTHWIGRWVDPRTGLGRGGEERKSKPLQGLEPLIIQPVAQC